VRLITEVSVVLSVEEVELIERSLGELATRQLPNEWDATVTDRLRAGLRNRPHGS
jgi:hypothetical protein